MPINGNARILVVDDEPQIRRFLSASLNSHEYTVIEAHTGNEAIRLCTTAQPDLVILDLGLPDIDGREVLSAHPRMVARADHRALGAIRRAGQDRRRSTAAPTITSPSRSGWASCWRACARP